MKDLGGPSQLDAEQFGYIILSKRIEIPSRADGITSKKVSYHSFAACQLNTLNKNPEVRPIEVAEILR